MFTHLHIGNAQYLDLMDLNELHATIMKPFGEGSNFKHLPWIEMNLMYPYKYIYIFNVKMYLLMKCQLKYRCF